MKIKKIFGSVILAFFSVSLLCSCDPEPIDITTDGEVAAPSGTLRVVFRISHPWLDPSKIIRTGLHLAENGEEVIRGNYLFSANVSDYQEQYDFPLALGTYYYEASIACICGGDTCSAAGFPGNQFARKHTMGKFDVFKDSVTTVIPTFR